MKHCLLFCFLTTFFLSLLCLSGWAQTADAYTLTTTRITSTSAQLNWTGINLNTTFDVRWRQQGTPDWITSSEITGTSFTLASLQNGQAYEWQLRPAGSAVWPSDPAVFTTLYGCSAPSLQYVFSFSVTAARLVWSSYNSSSSTTTSFTFDIKTSEATSWSSISGITGQMNGITSYTPQNLTPGITYMYRVRAICSPYSTIGTFATPACEVNNLQHEPQPTQTNLRWYQPLGAIATLRWRLQGATWNTVTGLTSNSFSLTGLTPNVAYEWQLQPICGGLPGDFTEPRSFTTACSPPTSVSALSITSAKVTVAWHSGYRLNSGYSFRVQYRDKIPANLPWATTSVIYVPNYEFPYDHYTVLAPLKSDTNYEVRVQSTCPNSTTSGFTDPPISFSTSSCTASATDLLGYAETLRSQYLYWSGESDNYYTVQYRQTGVNSWSQASVSHGNTSVTLQTLTPGTTYEWRVLAYCSPSVSAVTPGISQTFTMPVCTSSRLNSFRTLAIDYNMARPFWSESYPQAWQYVFRYRPVGADTYTTFPVQSPQTILLTNLAENTAYEWQVAVACSASATSHSFSAPQTFTTSCLNTASNLETRIGTQNSIQLTWNNNYSNSGLNQTYTVRYRLQGGDWTTNTVIANSFYPTLNLTGLQLNSVYEWGVCGAAVFGNEQQCLHQRYLFFNHLPKLSVWNEKPICFANQQHTLLCGRKSY